MKKCLLLFSVLSASLSSGHSAQLQEVASFPNHQVTGVGVSARSGRVFVNFPTWSDDHFLSVAEIVNGQPQAFPDEEWNKPGAPNSHFVCVQSVVVDDQDNLWILDLAAPKMQEILKGGPKLVKIDLSTNKVAQTIPFGEDIAPAKSYLNDVRIDTATGKAFITESGMGAIIVVDLKTGKARRLLDGHKSTAPESDVKLIVDGKQLIDQQTKKPPQMASDGIALDITNGYLYYHALTGRTLYRIKTGDLNDEKLSASARKPKWKSSAAPPRPMACWKHRMETSI